MNAAAPQNNKISSPLVQKPRLDPSVLAILKDDEKILRVAKIHSGIYWKSIAVGIIAIVMLFGPLFNLGVFMCLVTLILFTIATLYKHYLLLVLTDKRVLLRHGILRVDTIQIRHSRIESVETERTIMGQILGYASVVVYGTGSRITAIPFIADALEFRVEMDERLGAYEDKVTGDDLAN